MNFKDIHAHYTILKNIFLCGNWILIIDNQLYWQCYKPFSVQIQIYKCSFKLSHSIKTNVFPQGTRYLNRCTVKRVKDIKVIVFYQKPNFPTFERKSFHKSCIKLYYLFRWSILVVLLSNKNHLSTTSLKVR